MSEIKLELLCSPESLRAHFGEARCVKLTGLANGEVRFGFYLQEACNTGLAAPLAALEVLRMIGTVASSKEVESATVHLRKVMSEGREVATTVQVMEGEPAEGVQMPPVTGSTPAALPRRQRPRSEGSSESIIKAFADVVSSQKLPGNDK